MHNTPTEFPPKMVMGAMKSSHFQIAIYAFITLQFLLLATASTEAQQLAFPSAEGFGRFATGGRGGTVYHVTNLNDSGVGSFRDAVSVANRTVVFDVGGIIRINERIIVKNNITIAGQTAPGGGICIYGNGLSFSNANNTIVRHIRIRMGINGDSGKDAIALARGHDMMFDHVSVSWGRDGTFDINPDSGVEIENITIQNCIIGQGLETHSTGGLMQTTGGVSALRNLYIDNNTRNPKVKGINQFVNNVVYNWIVGAYILGDSDGPSAANVSNNYFINGPSTTSAAFTRGNTNFHIYASNNFQDSNKDGILNGSVIPQSGYGTVSWEIQPYGYPSVTQLSPVAAYNYVLANAGASIRRDQVDARLIMELTSLGRLGQTISNENNAPMNGPGTIAGGSAPADTDQDGMPNSWETTYGLNPNNASDRNGDPDADGYTNLEEYLAGLVGEGNGPGSSSTSTITLQENTIGFCSADGTIDTNHAGFTGSGFSNASNLSGAGINWRISVPSGGSYTLTWRHANGSTTARTGRLLVNGASVVSTISFPSTSLWTTWSDISVTVSLNAGSNTLRLEATNSTGLSNIDYLRITGSSPQALACAGSNATFSIQHQADDAINEIDAYPNPFEQSFQVKTKEFFSYKINDAFGNVVEKGNGNTETVVGSKLSPGMYHLIIITSVGSKSFRIVKN